MAGCVATSTPGKLTLRAQVDPWLMLRTAIQPGAKLDFEYPPETVTLVFKAGNKLRVKAGDNASVNRVSATETRVTVSSAPLKWLPLEIELATGNGEPRLDVGWFTAEDSRLRPLPLRRVLLPWATPKQVEATSVSERRIPEIAGGDWNRGKTIFFGEKAACSKCHQLGGAGGKIGPDLSNLIYRDYASVVKDITQPSAAINPDHLAYIIELKDGESVTGVIVENTTDHVAIGQANGAVQTIARNRIATMRASSLSLMPEGLLQALNGAQQRDLLTFLLTTPPKSELR